MSQGQFMQSEKAYGATEGAPTGGYGYGPNTYPNAGNDQNYNYSDSNFNQNNANSNYVASGTPYVERQGLPLEWILFIIGWLVPAVWIVGSFLPLCRNPRFESRRAKNGWIACVCGACLHLIIFIIAIAVGLSRARYVKYYGSYRH